MKGILLVRLLLLAGGALAMGYGVRTGQELFRWIGIGCMVAVLGLRAAGRITRRR